MEIKTIKLKIWKYTKYVLAIILGLYLASLALGTYFYYQNNKAFKESKFIAQLERAEKENRDTLHILFNEMDKINGQEAEVVVRWLQLRESRGDLPYLYIIGFYAAKQTDRFQRAEAMKYIAKGSLVYRVDANKCGDSSANQAVPILESALNISVIRDDLKKHPDIRKKFVDSALSYEEKTKNRALPKWICLHGMRPGATPPSDAEWQEKRRAIRASFEKDF